MNPDLGELKMNNKSFMRYGFGLIIAFILAACAGAQDESAEEGPERSIIEIGDDLYRAQNGGHYTVFLVTDEGIILSDPINTSFSTWLKAELDSRFGLPVRYVLYSHHHWDHASGGGVFEETAQFVGHENMIGQLAMPPADTTLPSDAQGMDSNGNGQLEESEASGFYGAQFALFDEDANGVINGAEATRGALKDVVPPGITYRDRLIVTLGGKSVELIHTGNMSHTDDMSIIRFVDPSSIFVVDWISLGRVPFRTLFVNNRMTQGSGMLDSWLNAIRMAEQLDYETASGGHGVVGDKSDVTAFRHYLEEMREQVAEGIAAGQSLEDMQASILMEPYSDWINYDTHRTLNVEGMYDMLIQ
ncbi:MAG: hypothetical protein CMM56_04785 [Rhodospirillaceae bacterium]|nr:hypothetical protein [Rhodospirillaceae bacterium]|tara:strand:- start:880 stop:1959 length:1080 start_codon:yes stop_codon:yes gene_type:complete